MSNIFVKDKTGQMARNLEEIRDFLLETRPAELSIKDLKKLNTTYYKTVALRYTINKTLQNFKDAR